MINDTHVSKMSRLLFFTFNTRFSIQIRDVVICIYIEMVSVDCIVRVSCFL